MWPLSACGLCSEIPSPVSDAGQPPYEMISLGIAPSSKGVNKSSCMRANLTACCAFQSLKLQDDCFG